MTDDTVSAADSAQAKESIIDDPADHGVMILDIGEFTPEPYRPRMDFKLNLSDGTRDRDVDHLRTLLFRANLADGR